MNLVYSIDDNRYHIIHNHPRITRELLGQSINCRGQFLDNLFILSISSSILCKYVIHLELILFLTYPER